ncbi:hypothetical protein PARA125_000398 [Parachlamydia sp. AcF125]|nr:hypothetical protein [Parachlamydia sp. AcF125]
MNSKTFLRETLITQKKPVTKRILFSSYFNKISKRCKLLCGILLLLSFGCQIPRVPFELFLQSLFYPSPDAALMKIKIFKYLNWFN